MSHALFSQIQIPKREYYPKTCPFWETFEKVEYSGPETLEVEYGGGGVDYIRNG